MASLAPTKLSSEGRVVIPEEIRLRLGLEEGTQFVVVGDRDVVILSAKRWRAVPDRTGRGTSVTA